MEIDIYMSSNEECLLPFSHHLALAVVENKWLMKNNLWHGKSVLYSFSLLKGERVIKALNGLAVAYGAMLSFGANDPELIRLMIENIRHAPERFYELEAREIILISRSERFSSPPNISSSRKIWRAETQGFCSTQTKKLQGFSPSDFRRR